MTDQMDVLKARIAELKRRRNALLSDYREAIAAYEQTRSEDAKNRAFEAHHAASEINDELNELEARRADLEDASPDDSKAD